MMAEMDVSCDVKSGYVGLGKEELLRYANDPFWVRLRWFLFISFWLLWAGMLIGAVMIIIAAPKCVPPAPKTWWESGPLVELPLDPLTSEQLAALTDRGATGVIAALPALLTDPFTVADTTALDDLLAQIIPGASMLRLIIDVDVLYSDKWFDLSERKVPGYENYYVWADARGYNASNAPNVPNNWLNPDDSSAWRYSELRRQFHLVDAAGRSQLNYRSPSVIAHARTLLSQLSTLHHHQRANSSAATASSAIAGGVRIRNVPRLLVDESLADEVPISTGGGAGTDYTVGQYGFYGRKHVENLADVADVLTQLRKGSDAEYMTTEKKDDEEDHDRVFMLYEQLNTLEPFQLNGSLLIDLPQQSKAFLPERLARTDSVAIQLKTDLTATLNLMEGNWPAWKVHKSSFPTDVINMVTFLLPGVPILDANDTWDPTLLEIRKSASIMYGSCNFYDVANQTTFVYVRVHSGNPGFIIAFNPTNESVVVNFPNEIPTVADEVTVQLVSSTYNETGIELNLKSTAKKFPLSAYSSVVLSYVPKSK